jgi:hypothetical protein
MAIATTSTFNPSVGDSIEEAFELCGRELRSGNDLRTARRSINYLTLEWANEGLNLWTVDSQTLTLVEGTSAYDLDQDTMAVLEAVLRTDSGDTSLQQDTNLERISFTTYSQIPNKLMSGRPSQFNLSRIGVLDTTAGVDTADSMILWPVPDGSGPYEIEYWRMRRIADTGASTSNTMEIPSRFQPAFVYGLAYRLSMKIAPERVPLLKAEYRELFKSATEEDRVKEDLRIIPDLSGY